MGDLNKNLNDFLGKKTSTRVLSDGSVESCDLETGECKVIKYKDGLIERNEGRVLGRSVNVETVNGEIKKLLTD